MYTNFSEMRAKYEAAMKEKMLITLERDRVVGILSSMPPSGEDFGRNDTPVSEGRPTKQVKRAQPEAPSPAPGSQMAPSVSSGASQPKIDTPFPTDHRINPQLDIAKKSNLVNRLSTLKVSTTHEGRV